MMKQVSTGLLLLATFLSISTHANEVHLRLNQIGFSPGDVKTAVLMAKAPLTGKFQVVSENGGHVFEGGIKALPGERWGQYPFHADLDFSSVKKPGKYVVQAGGSKSFPFEIRPTVYSPLPDQLLGFMHQQRCGYNPYVDAVCHSFDGRTAYGPMTNGTYMNCVGGWHDAGDQLQYLI